MKDVQPLRKAIQTSTIRAVLVMSGRKTGELPANKVAWLMKFPTSIRTVDQAPDWGGNRIMLLDLCSLALLVLDMPYSEDVTADSHCSEFGTRIRFSSIEDVIDRIITRITKHKLKTKIT